MILNSFIWASSQNVPESRVLGTKRNLIPPLRALLPLQSKLSRNRPQCELSGAISRTEPCLAKGRQGEESKLRLARRYQQA